MRPPMHLSPQPVHLVGRQEEAWAALSCSASVMSRMTFACSVISDATENCLTALHEGLNGHTAAWYGQSLPPRKWLTASASAARSTKRC